MIPKEGVSSNARQNNAAHQNTSESVTMVAAGKTETRGGPLDVLENIPA